LRLPGSDYEDGNAVLGIFPSNHHVLDEETFINSVGEALQAADRDRTQDVCYLVELL